MKISISAKPQPELTPEAKKAYEKFQSAVKRVMPKATFSYVGDPDEIEIFTFVATFPSSFHLLFEDIAQISKDCQAEEETMTLTNSPRGAATIEYEFGI